MIQSLYQVPEYDQDKINIAIARIMDDQDVASDLRPGMRVVIKPNLIVPRAQELPVTTHPTIIRAVALWLRDHGITDITLAESSGGPYFADYINNIYKVCGMTSLSDVLTLNQDFTSEFVQTKDGFLNHEFHLITPIVKADYIIDICKLKTHAMTGYSGGIKNLFGTIPGLEKPQMHCRWPDIEDFSNMLLELCQTVKPNLTIIDAVNAMEGNGPTGGTSHPLGLIFGSKDVYTQDYFAASLMKINPMEIVMIRQAVEKGLAKPDEFELRGDPIPKNLTAFKKPDSRKLDFSNFLPGLWGKMFAGIAMRYLKPFPKLNKRKCVGCGKCAESCPQQIIIIKNRKAEFTKKDCISCFCCQEMCPSKAIKIRRLF